MLSRCRCLGSLDSFMLLSDIHVSTRTEIQRHRHIQIDPDPVRECGSLEMRLQQPAETCLPISITLACSSRYCTRESAYFRY